MTVVHLVKAVKPPLRDSMWRDGTFDTICCGRPMIGLPQSEKVTVYPERVTCFGESHV